MKIIYEDSDDRSGGSKKPGMKNIGSSFSRSDVPPAVTSVHSSARKMRKETQSITAEEAPKNEREAAFSGEDADFAPPAQKKEQAASAPQQQPAAGQGAPEFKLTQEQIAFLLSQYLGSQAQSAASPSAGAQPAEPPKADETAQRAGTRIVFQSPDFDAPEELPKRREFSPVHIDYGYDIDGEDEDDEEDADDANDDDIASEPFYEVACPNCGETVYVSEDDLDAGEANCAHCGVTFEVALEGDEEEPDEDAPVQYEVTCPDCGTTAVFEEEELLEGEPKCPNCGKPLDFEVTEE